MFGERRGPKRHFVFYYAKKDFLFAWGLICPENCTPFLFRFLYGYVIVLDIFLAFPASPNLKVSWHCYFPLAMFSAYVSEITKTIEL